MYAGSAAARRRRVLIASRSEAPYPEGDRDPVSDPPAPRAHPDGNGNDSLRDANLGRQPNVTEPEEEPRSLEPTPSEKPPVRPPRRLEAAQGAPAPPAQASSQLSTRDSERKASRRVPGPSSLSVRSTITSIEGLPALPPATELARIREQLHPGYEADPVELRVFSRLTGDSEVIRIDATTALIGRGSQSDIRLMHPDVSRRHACVQVLEAGVLCYDLGSRTGVLWDGRQWPVGWITSKQSASIGPFEIRLASQEDGLDDAASTNTPRGNALSVVKNDDKWLGPPIIPDPDLESMGFEIIPASPSDPAPFMPLRSSVTLLGRGPHCGMRLEDERISRVHSSVMAASDGVWLMDLVGRGGVRVNGSRMSQARLEPGDEIQVGRHRLRFVTGRPVRPDTAQGRPGENRSGDEQPRTERIRQPNGEGFVSESLVLAMVETFADMQRQMQEQFSVQMNFMVEMVESLRQESRDEVRAELIRLKSLGEEIREAQSKLARERLPQPESPPSDAKDRDGDPPRERAPKSDATAPRAPETPHTPEEFKKDQKPRHYPVDAHRRTRELDGIADHAIVSRRLRELEEERDSSWQKLVRLIRPGH